MKCNLCGDEWPDVEGGMESGIDHLRVMHPDQFEEPERWPDGGLVIHDDTIEPADFNERPGGDA